MTYRCHVYFAMIESEGRQDENRQADRYIVHTASEGDCDGSGTC